MYNVCVCGHRKAKISLGPQLLILLALEVHLKRCHIQGSLKIEIEMFWWEQAAALLPSLPSAAFTVTGGAQEESLSMQSGCAC